MDDIKWKVLGIGVILTFLGQVSVWFQHNWQFVNPKYKPEWWGWYIMAIPITWFFLKGTQYGVDAFGGKVWPNRFIGFILGIGSYVYLTSYFLDEPVTWKIGAQLVLCFGIILIQVFWK